MDRADVLAVMKDKAHELLGIDPARITESASLRDDLDVDSLDLVEYTMAVEDAFGLEAIPEEEYVNAVNIGDFVTVVLRHVQASAASS
ncbi:MAG: phosphopantetheine-binding protein [Mycobacteriales bacterium]